MTAFLAVNLSGQNNRRDNWQKHHVVPTQQFNLQTLEPLFQAIQNPVLPDGVRYDHELFDFNGLLLPEGITDSLAFGFARHDGSHVAFSSFAGKMLEQIQNEMTSGSLSGEDKPEHFRAC